MYPTPMEKWKPQSQNLYRASVVVVLILWLMPLIIISLASFMTADQLNAGGRGLNLPSPFTLDGYLTALNNKDFMASFINSFIVVPPVVAISVALATMAGYGLSKYRFPGQVLIFAIFVGGNFVPFQILMVPVLRLTAPSGAVWEFGEDAGNVIEGLAAEFAQVVTQTRNIADTALKVSGPVAERWMATAQCFAGPPEVPPAKGVRHVVKG